MADHEDNSSVPQMDDRDLFQGAVAEEAPVKEEQSTAERERDEKGRFVAKAETPPEATAEPEKVEQPAQPKEAKIETPPEQPKTEHQDDGGNVPSWRLRELREARDAEAARANQEAQQRYALQAQLQQMQDELRKLQQPKQEPVDFYADPEKALQQHLTPMQQQMQTFMADMTLQMSRTAAIAQHGVDKVAEMEKAVAEAMQHNHPDMQTLAMQMRASKDPAGVAMNWYQRSKLVEETGGDIAAYKAKVLEEAMKDPQFQAKVVELIKGQPVNGAKPAPVVQLPPSLNRAPSAGQSNSADDGDMSDRALFRNAMAR